MAIAGKVRPGGRSARIAAAVRDAVMELSTIKDRSELTIPLIALKAGVPPSTIYRRWGSLSELMSDIAVDHMRPASAPLDTGSLSTDLQHWIEQYIEEASSQLGRSALRDIFGNVADMDNPIQCSGYTYGQLQLIAERAASRSGTVVPVDDLVDLLVAPIIYRILFGGRSLNREYGFTLVRKALLVITSTSSKSNASSRREANSGKKSAS